MVRALLGPWAPKEKGPPPLPYHFSKSDFLSLFLLVLLSIIYAYFTWLPTRDFLYYLLPPALGAAVVWFHAIHCLSLHRVTEQKRRFVASFVIFPVVYVSVFVVILRGSTAFICFLLKEKAQAATEFAFVVGAVAAMFLTRKLSRWVLRPVNGVDSIELRPWPVNHPPQPDPFAPPKPLAPPPPAAPRETPKRRDP